MNPKALLGFEVLLATVVLPKQALNFNGLAVNRPAGFVGDTSFVYLNTSVTF
jgi:hypothetical protein